MTYFTTENTEDFTATELATLNAAHAALVARHGADEEVAQTIGDMLNNAWVPGATEAQLVDAVARRLA